MEGEILEEMSITSVDEEQVGEILREMTGTLFLPVSAYSAIKKDGVPMYKRARKAEKTGDVVSDVPMRTMQVHEAELLGTEVKGDRVILTVRFLVGSGTYIRSLGEELGRRLGYPATLADLRRTKIGDFSIEMAKTLDEIGK